MPTTDLQRSRISEISDNLHRLFDDGQVVELRCLGPGKPLSGFFSNFTAVAAYAVAIEQDDYACYFGLSPRDPQKCPPTDELRAGKAAGEHDVALRRWLLIDVDPVRPAGVCSSDSEKKAAAAILRNVIEWLCVDRAWPRPLLADSGNGHHALFRVDLPADDDGIVERCLSALDARFSTQKARIDAAVFDAPRICRLYGTRNCKGEATKDRPHRYSRLLPGQKPRAVPIEKLQAIAGNPSASSKRKNNQAANRTTELTEHSAAHTASVLAREQPDDRIPIDAVTIQQAAWEWMEEQDLAVSGDGGHNRTFAVACGLVVGHGLSVDEARPIIHQYNDKLTEKWTDSELEHKLRDARRKLINDPGKIGYLLRGKCETSSKKKTAQCDQLIGIINQQELWHSPEREAFATVDNAGHRENLAISSKAFEHWLGGEFYSRTNDIAKKTAMTDAIDTATGLAIHRGATRSVHLRLAGHTEHIYVDLGAANWEAVEVSAGDWRVLGNPPVKFRRTPGMQPLPEPTRGGNISDLRRFVNLSSHQDFVLLVAWLVMGFHPEGEYPILALGGQQGTSKSTTARVLRSLLDPNLASLRSSPRTEDDFAVEAHNNRIVVFDNLSSVQGWLSDALCRLSSGGASAKRQLYTDSSETLLQYSGPAIINGIVDLARRPDLLDRCLVLDLPVLEKRRTKRSFWRDFETAQPAILGGLLDAVSHALGNPNTLSRPPRMAEFAEWACSAEPALASQWNDGPYRGEFEWVSGTFLRLYEENISVATAIGLDQSVIVPFLRKFAERYAPWEGSPASLLAILNKSAGGTAVTRNESWPKTAVALGMFLNRHAPALRTIGVVVEKGKRSGERFWTVRTTPPTGQPDEGCP